MGGVGSIAKAGVSAEVDLAGLKVEQEEPGDSGRFISEEAHCAGLGRGLTSGQLRLKVFKDPTTLGSRMEGLRQAWCSAMAAKGPALLADWLKCELQDVEQVMTPTRNLFLGLCGTPTVLGIAENPRRGGQARLAGIVSAHMEVDTTSVMDAFGKACAARLFARRSYLVVPKRQQTSDLMYLYALCELFGLGLVLFDERSTAAPSFWLAVRPFDHDPDPIYEDRCFRQLEEFQSA